MKDVSGFFKVSSGNAPPGAAFMVCKKLHWKVTFLRNVTEQKQRLKIAQPGKAYPEGLPAEQRRQPRGH